MVSNYITLLLPDGPINATYISVYNAQRVGGPDGTLDDIFGYAFLPDPAEPGQLYVFLDGGNPGGAECEYLTYYFPLFQMKFLSKYSFEWW